MARNSKNYEHGEHGEHGELKLHEKIRLFDVDLPIEHMLKMPSITIVIRSLIEKNNKCYLELSLNHCLYILQNNDFNKN